jgi:predicted nucleotidyltransferase
LLAAALSRGRDTMPTDFLSVLREFERVGIRYVLVGGLAVMLHGVDRLTADIDLVVDLAPEEAAKAIRALLALGFKPHAPVDALGFADPALRERWRTDAGMVVLSFWDPENRRPTVDLFTDYPMDFQTLLDHSIGMPLATVNVQVASIDDLVAIKRASGREKDLDDVQRLLELHKGDLT